MQQAKYLKILLLLFSTTFFSACDNNPCDYPDDMARDGSRCGDRAASIRPGGRNPDTDWLSWAVFGGLFLIGYASLLKERRDKNLNVKNEPLKNLLEPIGLGKFADSTPEYAFKKRIFSDSLNMEIRTNPHADVKQDCIKRLRQAINAQQQQIASAKYYTTKNHVVSTKKYPLLGKRNQIILYLILLNDEIISVEEYWSDERESRGYLNPLKIVSEGGRLYTVTDHGKFQIADEFSEKTFSEFVRHRETTMPSSELNKWEYLIN